LGKYVWVLADFAVDNRNEGDTPGRNDKGLVTFDRGIKKDAFYWYQANWSETPMVYITGRRHQQRNRSKIEIKVYSNQAEVELKVNGKSLGRKQRGSLPRFSWDAVALELGENSIEAIAHSTHGKLTDEVTFTRVMSDDTGIESSLLGVDIEAGKIYNPPFGATLESLSALLSLPDESELTVIDAEENAVLKAGMQLRLTAQDGSTRRDYRLAQAPISVAKPVWASAEISADLSIGPIDIPEMSARRANDGIVKVVSDGLTDVNIWNTMGGNKHWWKVDLGTDYYLESIEIVWPQHASMLEPGAMAYSVETADHFEQTFDRFSESYVERVDRRDNEEAGTTRDRLGITGRFVRVKLHRSGIFADTPMMGKYPIYGAEEITIVGGLLHSETLEIDYRQHIIEIAANLTAIEVAGQLHAVEGGSLEIRHADGALLTEQQVVEVGSLVIARDASGRLAEKYRVR